MFKHSAPYMNGMDERIDKDNTSLNGVEIGLLILYFCLFFYTIIVQNRYIEITGMLSGLCVLILLYQIVFIQKGIVGLDTFPNSTKLFILALGLMDLFGSIGCPALADQIISVVRTTEYCAIMIAIIMFVDNKRKLNVIIEMLIIVIVLMSFIFAISPQAYRGREIYGRYSFAKNMNPNGLGLLLNLAQWGIIYLFVNKKIKIVPFLLLIVLETYCVFLTGSRKAFITTLFLVVLYILLCGFKSFTKLTQTKKILLALGMPIVLVLLYLFFYGQYQSTSLAYRMENMLHEITEGERHGLYTYGWQLFKEHFIVGIGFNGYQYYQGVEYSHSTIIESLVIGGIVPFLVYWSSYYRSFKDLRLSMSDNAVNGIHRRVSMILLFLMVFTGLGTSHITTFTSYLAFGIYFSTIKVLCNEEKETHELHKKRFSYIL